MLAAHRRWRRPPAACDRRPADGRHEHRRRPVRPGQDVPAAGGEKCARDEAGGGPPAALHRGRKTHADRRRRLGQGQRQDRHRHGERRRARHRQEHRHRRAPVQQLRSHQHGRDGAVPGHPGQSQGRRRRPDRPVGPDHPEPGRDAACRRRNAARRLLPHEEDSALDRRCHHQPRAHRREDRAALRRAGGLRARRVTQCQRVYGVVVRRACGEVHRRTRGRLRAHARAARQQEGHAAGDAGTGACQQGAGGLGRLHTPGAEVHRPPDLSQLRPGRARRPHRLGPVLPDLGPGRQVPRDPARRSRGRRGHACHERRQAAVTTADRRALAAGEWCDPAAAGEHRRRRRDRDLRRRVTPAGAPALAAAASAKRAADRSGCEAPQPLPGRLHRAQRRGARLHRPLRRHRRAGRGEEGTAVR